MKSLPMLIIFVMISVCRLSAQVVEKGTEQNSIVSISTTDYKTELSNYYINYRNGFADDFDGSYQFMISGNTRMLITTETLDLIKNSRKKTEEQTITISEFVKVRILSQAQIKSLTKIPIEQLFILE